MNYSFDLPSEPRLSNSALKNRPTRTRIRPRRKVNPLTGLDDTVPLKGKETLYH